MYLLSAIVCPVGHEGQPFTKYPEAFGMIKEDRPHFIGKKTVDASAGAERYAAGSPRRRIDNGPSTWATPDVLCNC
jgi:hypothetical protein